MIDINDCVVEWVEDSVRFEALAINWSKCKVLAIDTEFERRTTYYPILALVQVFDGHNVYLIDPLKVKCPDVFKALCADRQIVKIMHSAREDLEVFYHSWGCLFEGLFDTQVAYAFLTGEMSKGYAPLVEDLCQQLLDKKETRSDWMKRPLSTKQLDYAAKDVLYLPQIFRQLMDKLKHRDFFPLFEAECNELCSHVGKVINFDLAYRSVSEVWSLRDAQLNSFKALYQWREQTAIKENRTKNHILKDQQLVQIAMYMPKNKAGLHKIKDIHPRSIRLYWQAITLVLEANRDSSCHLVLVPNPRNISQLTPLSERLLKVIKIEASKIGIATNLLASKRVIKKIAYAQITGESYPDIWAGWRGTLLKPIFNPVFSQFNTSKAS